MDAAERLQELERRVHAGSPTEPLEEAEQLLRQAELDCDTRLTARCLALIAYVHQTQGRNMESLLTTYRALELFTALGDDVARCTQLSRAAVDLARMGDAGESMRLMTEAQTITQRLDIDEMSFRFYNNLAVARDCLGDPARALDAIDVAEHFARAMGDPVAEDFTIRNRICYQMVLAKDALVDGDRGQGLSLIESARPELARALNEFEDASNTSTNKLDMLSEAVPTLIVAGEHALALDLGERGIELARTSRMLRPECRLRIALAELHRDRGDLNAAARQLDAVERVLQDAGMLSDDVTQVDETSTRYLAERSRLLEAQGDLAGALAMHRRYHRLDSLRLRMETDVRGQVLAARLVNEQNRLQADLMRVRATQLEQDIESLHSERDDLIRAAEIDPLTGVGNRRYFDERLAGFVRGDRQAALVMLDLDRFKLINDGFSHATGDRVLMHLGQILQHACRPQDVVCRYGGEEFVLLIDGADEHEGVSVAERVRRAVLTHRWAAVNPGLSVTASLGVAPLDGGIDASLRAADSALYLAKASGRNRVCAASDVRREITLRPSSAE